MVPVPLIREFLDVLSNYRLFKEESYRKVIIIIFTINPVRRFKSAITEMNVL